ncbi:uncharacterized protein LOC144114542 [Amblyomma americanum]
MDDVNTDWAPTPHLGYGPGERPAVGMSARFARTKARQKKAAAKAIADAATRQSSEDECTAEVTPADDPPHESCSLRLESRAEIAVQTAMTVQDIQAVEEDNKRLAAELRATTAEKKNKLEMSESSFHGDDAKVTFYTGLNSFPMLFAICELVECHVKHTAQNGLGKFEEFVVFPMKLKWNFPVQGLGYRFCV